MTSISTLYRRQFYRGRKGRSATRKLLRLDMGQCPACGAALDNGYGLCGGGCGSYTFCPFNLDHYFDKVQDTEEAV